MKLKEKYSKNKNNLKNNNNKKREPSVSLLFHAIDENAGTLGKMDFFFWARFLPLPLPKFDALQLRQASSHLPHGGRF